MHFELKPDVLPGSTWNSSYTMRLVSLTGVSVQEDNFENQIVLLDGLSPKKNCPGSKKIVLLDGLFSEVQKTL